MSLSQIGTGMVVLFGSLSAAFAGPVYWTTPSGSNSKITYSNGQSDKGLYGEPTVAGSKISFLTPHDFAATAANGSAQTTSDRLSFYVASVTGGDLDTITVHEFGDWSILGGSATVKATGALFLTNGSLTGTPVVPTARYTNTDTGTTTPIKPVGDSDGVWAEDYFYDLPAGTKTLTVVLNNILQAAAPGGATSFIQKKGIEITINDPAVPEPTAIGLAVLGGGAFVLRRRRRA